MIKFWEDAKDIKIVVGETLSHAARRDDLIGWVRAEEQANAAALANEIARLSKENAELRDQLGSRGKESTINGLTFRELMNVLRQNNYLEWLRENCKNFSVKRFVEGWKFPDIDFDELCLRGIFKLGKSADVYILTDDGFCFLNRLDLDHS